MDLLLSNKVAIVTGAGRGIGKAIAETMSVEGMRVVLVARSGEGLESLAKSLPNESLVQAFELREPDSANQVVAATIGKFGRLDLLVNNAGATKRGDFLALTDEEWTDGFALKFYAAVRLSRAAWPHLQAVKGGIINIIGIGGRTGSRVCHRRRGQCRLDEPHESPSGCGWRRNPDFVNLEIAI